GNRYPPSATQQTNCVLLVDIPRSSDPTVPRPYNGEDPRVKAAEYQRAEWSAGAILLVMGSVLLVLAAVSLNGFEDSRSGDLTALHKWLIALVFLAFIFCASFVTDNVCIATPWHTFEQVVEYYRFFNDLPRRNGHLSPLPASDFYFILAGPPSPKETQI